MTVEGEDQPVIETTLHPEGAHGLPGPVVEATITPPPPPGPKGEFRQCKPNPQWPDEVRYLIRFYVAAKGEKLDPCPVCGSKRKGRWTMLCPFRAFTLGQFAVQPAGEFAPLVLVCSEHPINPTAAIMEAL